MSIKNEFDSIKKNVLKKGVRNIQFFNNIIRVNIQQWTNVLGT